MPQPVDYEHLRSLLTAERLGSCMEVARGDLKAAFELYEWNMEVAAAAMSLTAMVEVVLRTPWTGRCAIGPSVEGWATG